MRPGAQIDEITVLEIGDLFAFGNVREIAQFEFAGLARPFAQAAETAGFGILEGLLAGDDDFLEDVVRLDLLFHLRLDFFKILGRNAVMHSTS